MVNSGREKKSFLRIFVVNCRLQNKETKNKFHLSSKSVRLS